MENMEENNGSIVVESTHIPFSISGPNAYYVGFEDFVPDSLGYHIKNSMNGLWFPPFRLLSSISFLRGSEVMKPIRMKVTESDRTFDFGGEEIILWFSCENGSFNIRLHVGDSVIPIQVILDTGVIPVWGKDAEYSSTIIKNDMGVTWKILPINEKVSLNVSGNHQLSIVQSRVVITLEEDTILTFKRNPDSMTGENAEEWASVVREMGTVINASDRSLDGYYKWAKSNMKWLYFQYNDHTKCIAAGQPEFPWFFSIDTFISLEGILSAGFFDMARNSLDTLFKLAASQNGKMPHEILATGEISNSGNLEETAYMPIALNQYYAWTGDEKFVRKHFKTALKGMNQLAGTDLRGKAVMEDHAAGEGVDIDTVSYFVSALESLEKLSEVSGIEITGESLGSPGDLITTWKKFILQEMWMNENNAFADRYIDGIPVLKGFWTTIMPFEQGIAEKSQFEKFVKSGHYGRIVGKEGLRVDPNGLFMPVNTGLLVNAALNYDFPGIALDNFRANLNTFGRYSTASYPEISNNESGCFLQAWSAALTVENIICGFLGIRPSNDGLQIDPKCSELIAPGGLTLHGLNFRSRKYSVAFTGTGKYSIDEVLET